MSLARPYHPPAPKVGELVILNLGEEYPVRTQMISNDGKEAIFLRRDNNELVRLNVGDVAHRIRG